MSEIAWIGIKSNLTFKNEHFLLRVTLLIVNTLGENLMEQQLPASHVPCKKFSSQKIEY